MLMKDKIEVEKQIYDLYEDYKWFSDQFPTKSRIKYNFVQFLLNSSQEAVNYGIDLIIQNKDKNSDIYELLYPVILEYRTFGLLKKEEKQEIKKEKWWQKIINNIKLFIQNLTIENEAKQETKQIMEAIKK